MSHNLTTTSMSDCYSLCGTSLPDNYQPCDNTVIIGRGRQAYNHQGNKRFQKILQEHRQEYESASSRSDKTSVIVKVYQGEGRRTEDNLYLGEFELRGIDLPIPADLEAQVDRSLPQEGPWLAIGDRLLPGAIRTQ